MQDLLEMATLLDLEQRGEICPHRKLEVHDLSHLTEVTIKYKSSSGSIKQDIYPCKY